MPVSRFGNLATGGIMDTVGAVQDAYGKYQVSRKANDERDALQRRLDANSVESAEARSAAADLGFKVDPNATADQITKRWGDITDLNKMKFQAGLANRPKTLTPLEEEEIQSRINANKATAAEKWAAANGTGLGSKISDASFKLRGEYNQLPTTKATQDVAQSIERIRGSYEAASKSDSPAADMAMIFGLMKMQDPGSTVREGEYANAQNAGSAWDKLGNIYNSVRAGTRLSPAQRQDFMNQAESLYAGQHKAQQNRDSQYQALAQSYGVDPKLVLMKFPDPRQLQAAVQRERSEPGFMARLFGTQSRAPKRQSMQDPLVSPQDAEAIAYLKANPQDPDAPAVAAKLRAKGIKF